MGCHTGNGSSNRIPAIHVSSTASYGAPAEIRPVGQRGPAYISPIANKMRESPVRYIRPVSPGEMYASM